MYNCSIAFHFQQSSNGPVKKSMREKAVERRNVNKEHNSNFKAGYIPIDEDRLHKTGLRGRKGSLAICVVILLFILAVINLIVSIRCRILFLITMGNFSSFLQWYHELCFCNFFWCCLIFCFYIHFLSSIGFCLLFGF